MIRITQDTINTVVITTTEKGTAEHYLFKFWNFSRNTASYCIAADTSAFQNRYNAFSITDQPSPTPTAGEVDLATGEHKYFVYGNTNATNLDPTGLTLLESGMCIVSGTETSPTEYDNTATYTVYNG